MKNKNILNIYHSLSKQYGHQHWWPAETPFEMMVGAILTQSATWQNVEKAVINLKTAGVLYPEKLRVLSVDELVALIRPSGYYNAKSKKIKALVAWLYDSCGDDIPRLSYNPVSELRKSLLTVHGIGYETADSILLYAVGKPVFVIDAYTRRILTRIGITPVKDSYSEWQKLLLDNLPQDVAIFNEYHALLVHHAKEHCRTKPFCTGCCLFDICAYGEANYDQ